MTQSMDDLSELSFVVEWTELVLTMVGFMVQRRLDLAWSRFQDVGVAEEVDKFRRVSMVAVATGGDKHRFETLTNRFITGSASEP